jgi:hypothetical protein
MLESQRTIAASQFSRTKTATSSYRPRKEYDLNKHAINDFTVLDVFNLAKQCDETGIPSNRKYKNSDFQSIQFMST